MDRKGFLRSSTALSGVILLGACGQDIKKQTSKIDTTTTYSWKMVTTWPPNFPVLGEACQKFADWVYQMSAGQMSIKVYGAGELIPALEVFDAVSSGAAELGNGAAYYWAGKAPSAQFFASIPFGMNAQQMNAWLYSGGGLHLWQELYKKFGLKVFPSGNTGMQMGGWFNKEINTIEDFKGLKMRMPGLGAKVLAKAGATAVLSSGSEIYTNLERGVIDATEWIGPYHDYVMGFHKIAKYYYSPGWHEPGSVLENIINLKAFEELPDHLKEIIQSASARMNIWVLSEFEAKNNEYLNKIKEEKTVELRRFSPDILSKLKVYTDEVLAELCNIDENSKVVFASFDKFRKDIRSWAAHSEKLYHEL
ncbi:MAG: TRAP transporter substrate-binding protein [Saprospiraceae bacterium]|jgi:TRAP-type mannitol/chloroaromatic compound transport system substrate-binding protein